MTLIKNVMVSVVLLIALTACETGGLGPVSASQARAYAETFALPGETVTDHVYSGVVGSRESVIVFAHDDTGLKAFLVNVNALGGYREELPPLYDVWLFQELKQVLFEDVDGDGATELLIVATYITGNGPNAATPFHSVSVLDWTENGVVRRRDIEEVAMVRRLDEGLIFPTGLTDTEPEIAMEPEAQ